MRTAPPPRPLPAPRRPPPPPRPLPAPRRPLCAPPAAPPRGALLPFLPRPALAAGSVTLSTREPVEEDGRWKLKFSIDYGSIPQIPHIPMIFSFTPVVL